MRIKVWVETAQEVDADISIAEVMSSIAELAESDQLPMLLDCVNCVHRVLRDVPDERIGQLTTAQRIIIGNALRVQADRYGPGRTE